MFHTGLESPYRFLDLTAGPITARLRAGLTYIRCFCQVPEKLESQVWLPYPGHSECLRWATTLLQEAGAA
jgi:hypothetical protein